ncbi:prepilin-type N-terminal cleavage/methylation domain-containing protein [Abditibacterium utsteinense]|uniref:Prepilin-type N-terminal cleavage/methylation domain-containing protein n=1 Tax=Abditibacterium utsteinense TaxID=1960156 RepID=A0A2S8SVV7_9BACT|nr:prepilin-type N-terminal cleavage/methylation domain-containing protein [Abditibacterium utsteinense]PQV64923.1 prepilin-type N-terminal cleavage/methylation domain-containing protein [Abditibacterium utsteinense]
MKITPTYLGKPRQCSTPRRGGFTLVEILVAVGIMALLLAIILVPLRLGFETYHIGTARSGVQQEAQLTMQQIGKDLSRASFIFPNSRIPGISDNTSDSTSGCSLRSYPSDGSGVATDWKYLPYVKSETAPAAGANTDPANSASGIGITNQSSTPRSTANSTRIDMLFLRRNPTSTFPAQTGEDYVVTYYPRRVNINQPYDSIDNPIVLFRAQYPYRYYYSTASSPTTAGFAKFPATPTAPTTSTTPLNAEVDWSQYPTLGSSSSNADVNRNFLWITHNYYGEANLEPLTRDEISPAIPAAQIVPRSHALAIPRGMQLVAPKANTTDSGAYMPELSFVESSTSGNRIDRVTVNMTLAQYDQIGAASVNGQGKAQRVAVSQTFDLPNAGCSK